jgi:hypothetical protein
MRVLTRAPSRETIVDIFGEITNDPAASQQFNASYSAWRWEMRSPTFRERRAQNRRLTAESRAM